MPSAHGGQQQENSTLKQLPEWDAGVGNTRGCEGVGEQAERGANADKGSSLANGQANAHARTLPHTKPSKASKRAKQSKLARQAPEQSRGLKHTATANPPITSGRRRLSSLGSSTRDASSSLRATIHVACRPPKCGTTLASAAMKKPLAVTAVNRCVGACGSTLLAWSSR